MKKTVLYIISALIVAMPKDSVECLVKTERTTVENARFILSTYENRFTSGVGHEGTAELAEKLFFVEVPCERTLIEARPKDKVIVIKPVGRKFDSLKELSEEEVKEIGYELFLQEYL